jgi:hypothetical protein
LENFPPFLFEHYEPLPPPFLHRLQKRTLPLPTIKGCRVEKAHAVAAANPAPQAQRRRLVGGERSR